MRIVGHSMTPSLPAGTVVFVDETAYASHEPQHGDLVAAHPVALAGHPCVKRIIGLPHERVVVEQRAWDLATDEYFLLGDHADDSLDSRVFGPVNRTELLGRIWFRWPWTLIRRGSASRDHGLSDRFISHALSGVWS